MGLHLVYHEAGGTGLIALCDICGKRAYAGEANICWLPPAELVVGQDFNFKITCKDVCTRTLDKKEGAQFTQELDMGVFFLVNNTRTNIKEIRRKVRSLYQLGMVV